MEDDGLADGSPISGTSGREKVQTNNQHKTEE